MWTLLLFLQASEYLQVPAPRISGSAFPDQHAKLVCAVTQVFKHLTYLVMWLNYWLKNARTHSRLQLESIHLISISPSTFFMATLMCLSFVWGFPENICNAFCTSYNISTYLLQKTAKPLFSCCSRMYPSAIYISLFPISEASKKNTDDVSINSISNVQKVQGNFNLKIFTVSVI